MGHGIAEDIGKIRDFETLLKYLQRNLDWPIDLDEIEELTFEYQPEELGLDEECRVKIKEIKHLRPFSTNQPWGIFWIEFENRHLPVVVMRRILRALVPKKRASARPADRAVWNLKDLLFISSLGEHGHRRITFSHFREDKDAEPTLETFSWDERETHFYYLERLHLDRLRWPSSTADVEGWRRQWAAAFTSAHREPIRTAKELSQELAALAARTRDLVLEVLKYERSDGPLHRLCESFQKVLLHDLKEDGFADMVAQTVAYGLFTARCTGQEVLGLAHLEAMVPNTNRFLKELFAELASISGHKKGQINFDDLGLSEMVDLLKNTNIEAVLEDFGRQTGGGKEDPVVHFYETFLHVYDKRQKVQRGVFYTPKPVVSFIVRSVHEILQSEFGLPDGLADTTTWGEMADRHPGLQIPPGVKPDAPFVLILDPATGTGTFLEEVIDVIHKTMTSKWQKQGKNLAQQHETWNEYVPKHLLPRLHGFELMMAPYSVAHMKLGLKLRQTGYDFKSSQQLRVYLTNTLEPPEKGNRKLGFLPDFLSHESMQADLVKERKPITVVIGNPPYSGHSANKREWSRDLLRMRLPDGADSYFKVNGAPLDERNPKWLNDDYVKFLRYGQFRIASTGAGILGFITNHSYLDNPTFRGMRQSMAATFTKATFIDLHGNTKKNERSASGAEDENVFDIQQGVAISIWRRPVATSSEELAHLDLWGIRENKYDWLIKHSAVSSDASLLKPTTPNYLFTPLHNETDLQYASALSLPEIFPVHSLGIATARDHLTVKWSPKQVWDTVIHFVSLKSEKAREMFDLGPDASDWKVELAQADLKVSGPSRHCVHPILYRPFDTRFTYYTGHSRGFHCRPRNDVMQHFLVPGNVGLIGARGVEVAREYDQAFCTRVIIQLHTLSLKEVNYVFPLFIRQSGDQERLTTHKQQADAVNFSRRFLEELKAKGLLAHRHGHRAAFHYIYAILYSRSYRLRYSEELKTSFPRIPVTGVMSLFTELSQYGADLIALHLLEEDYELASWNSGSSRRESPLSKLRAEVWGDGSHFVETGYPQFCSDRVWLNTEQWIGPVSDEIWRFKIGGYQVCEKWLKDRRGRKLTDAEVLKYRKVVAAIGETIRIMQCIDQAIEAAGGWPIS